MPAIAMDHFTVLANDVDETIEFYGSLLGLKPGPRPPFNFPGAWLYGGGRAVLHLVGGRALPDDPHGVLDHMAFSATGLADTVAALQARGITYRLAHIAGGGVWQLFFPDPNGATVELDFPGDEAAPAGH